MGARKRTVGNLVDWSLMPGHFSAPKKRKAYAQKVDEANTVLYPRPNPTKLKGTEYPHPQPQVRAKT